MSRWFESEAAVPATTVVLSDEPPSISIPVAETCEVSEHSSPLKQLCDSRPLAAIAAGLIVGSILCFWSPPLVRCKKKSTYEAHNEYITEVSIPKVVLWSVIVGVLVYLVMPLVVRRMRKA